MPAVKPVSVMVPVEVAQFVGLVKLFPLITGVGLIATVVELFDEQLPNVAVAVYTPASATVALVLVGFCNVFVKVFGPDHV